MPWTSLKYLVKAQFKSNDFVHTLHWYDLATARDSQWGLKSVPSANTLPQYYNHSD